MRLKKQLQQRACLCAFAWACTLTIYVVTRTGRCVAEQTTSLPPDAIAQEIGSLNRLLSDQETATQKLRIENEKLQKQLEAIAASKESISPLQGQPQLETVQAEAIKQRSRAEKAEAALKALQHDSQPPVSSPTPKLLTGQPNSAQSSAQAWLRIIISTVARRSEDYLTPVLRSIVSQVPYHNFDPLGGRVQLVVVNNQKNGAHSAFLEAQKLPELARKDVAFLEGRKARRRRRLLGAQGAVQQQTHDVLNAIHLAQALPGPPPAHTMLVEDDFMLCSNGLLALVYLLQKLGRYTSNHWRAARSSFGLNGIIFNADASLNSFRDYLSKHSARKPPDLLFADWVLEQQSAAGQGRAPPFFAFRHNTFFHVGSQSTLPGHDGNAIMPHCWEVLNAWMQPQEMFNLEECGHDDIWPCPRGRGKGAMQVDSRLLPIAGSDSVAMVDWTAGRLCDGCNCVVPQGVMRADLKRPPKLPAEVVKECRAWKAEHGVQMGRTWGSLPERLRERWKKNDCDRAFGR